MLTDVVGLTSLVCVVVAGLCVVVGSAGLEVVSSALDVVTGALDDVVSTTRVCCVVEATAVVLGSADEVLGSHGMSWKQRSGRSSSVSLFNSGWQQESGFYQIRQVCG